MKAVKRFKDLLFNKRPEARGGIFGSSSRLVAPPSDFRSGHEHRKTQSSDSDNRKPLERILATEGVHHDIDVSDDNICRPRTMEIASIYSPRKVTGTTDDEASRSDSRSRQHGKSSSSTTESLRTHSTTPVDHAKGHAHDPLLDLLFLDIGAGAGAETPPAESGVEHVLSESPGAVEMNVYETAYEEEMRKILERRGNAPTIYLTRRVEGNQAIREHESIIRESKLGLDQAASGLASLVQKAVEHKEHPKQEQEQERKYQVPPTGFAGLVEKAREYKNQEGGDGDHNREGQAKS